MTAILAAIRNCGNRQLRWRSLSHETHRDTHLSNEPMLLCRPHTAGKPVIYSSAGRVPPNSNIIIIIIVSPSKWGLDNNRLYLLRGSHWLYHIRRTWGEFLRTVCRVTFLKLYSSTTLNC